MVGALEENGPCFVGGDSNSTYLNPYSWNNEVNVLYLDQPVQVGYSYDTLHNATLDLGSSSGDFTMVNLTLADFSEGVPQQNNTFYVGTFASQNLTFTANSTTHAATALWHFAQTWFEEFPFYKPHNERISIWTESYGGKYGPVFTHFFQTQNEKISNGTIKGPGVHYIHLDTLGIVNGCIDSLAQDLAYLDQAYNNTYAIQAINQSVYEAQIHDYSRPGGCMDQMLYCRKLAAESDPNDDGAIEKVNAACITAGNYCGITTVLPYFNYTNVSYSLSHPEDFPPLITPLEPPKHC